MRGQVSGKIISNQLGIFGPNETKYGYISVQTKEKTTINIKIDAYTQYETLKIGDAVIIETEPLGNTDILVARKIILDKRKISYQANTAEVAT
jgi:hypothetical protein